MQVILKDEIIQKLKEVGLKNGDAVMVHTSLGKMGYVCGGAQAVIEALMEVVGDSGTIMMPTQSWKNLDPETGVHWEADQKDWQLIRDNWPAYDKNLTPTNTMGAVAEMFGLDRMHRFFSVVCDAYSLVAALAAGVGVLVIISLGLVM